MTGDASAVRVTDRLSLDRPLRIAFVGEGDPENAGAAGANSPAMLIAALRRRGVDVASVDCEVYGVERAVAALATWSRKRARWTGRYHLHPRAFALRSNAARRGLSRIRGGVDAVIQYGTAFDARMPGVPMLVWCDTCAIVTRGEPYSWMTALSNSDQRLVIERERELMNAASYVMPWSQYAGRRITEAVGVPSERVRVTYVGPSIDTFRPRGARPLGRTGDPLRVLFVGREFERKGGDVVLRAIERLRHGRLDVRVSIVGPTSLPDRFKPEFVDFVGFLDKSVPSDVERLRVCYDRADIFCLPTRREPFGIAVAEAMLAGLPVVATAISAIPEMVSEGETGYLVQPDDEDAVVDRLGRLAVDQELRDRMGVAGAERARAKFTWDAVAASVEDALRDAILGGGRPR